MNIDDLNPPERAVLQGALKKDEELLWVGQPKPRLWTVTGGLLFLCGMLSLLGGIGTVIYVQLNEGSNPANKLLLALFCTGLPLVLPVVAAPRIGLRWQRRCVYALTTGRAIIIRYLLGKYHFRDIVDLERQPREHREHVDGTVSLIMGESNISSTNGRPDPEGFLHLPPDAWQEPEQLLRRMAKTAGEKVVLPQNKIEPKGVAASKLIEP